MAPNRAARALCHYLNQRVKSRTYPEGNACSQVDRNNDDQAAVMIVVTVPLVLWNWKRRERRSGRADGADRWSDLA